MVEYAVISYFLVNEENTFGRWVFFLFFYVPGSKQGISIYAVI